MGSSRAALQDRKCALGVAAEVLLQAPSHAPGRGNTPSERAVRPARMVGEGTTEGDVDEA